MSARRSESVSHIGQHGPTQQYTTSAASTEVCMIPGLSMEHMSEHTADCPAFCTRLNDTCQFGDRGEENTRRSFILQAKSS